MALLTFVYVQSDLFDVDADSGEYVNEMNEDTMTNMSLDVGQLHLNDLEDSDKYDSTGYGVSVSTGGSGTAYKGFRDKETDDIGINVGEGGTNLNDGSETYSVMVHEVSHQNGSDETKAHFLTDVAADSWNTENQFNGNATNTSKVNQGEWLNNQTTDSDGNRTADSLINQNTIKASQVDEFDPYITVQLHEVAFDKYHASIKFKPVNQELYERNDDFRIDPIDGKRYITLGAGPSLGDNKLTGNLARKNDMQIDNKVLESLPIVSIEKEDEVFNQLIELNENYNQNPLEYDMFPNPNKTKISKVSNVGGKLNRPGDSYNSNSYVSGILSAADVYVPPIDQDLDVSGYNKPVPKENFIGEN